MRKEIEKKIFGRGISNKEWLSYGIIIFSLLVGIYLNFDLINVVLFSSIIAMIVMAWSSRFIGVVTLILIVIMSFASYINRPQLAAELSVWIFYSLIIFIVKAVIEVVNWEKSGNEKDR